MENGKKFKRKNFTQAADLIHVMLQKSNNPLSHQFLRWKLWTQWEQVAGPSIAKNTSPVGYDKGVLYVWVKSAAWMQEMTFLQKPLKDKINIFAGKKWIHMVKFTLDRKSVPNLQEIDEGTRNFLSK